MHLIFNPCVFVSLKQLSLYCLVDEVLRRGEIMPDEKKNLTFHYFFIFDQLLTKNPMGQMHLDLLS